jgi:hypothetical protein
VRHLTELKHSLIKCAVIYVFFFEGHLEGKQHGIVLDIRINIV